jgi:uncharacterized protein (TIGR03437 family)
LNQPKGVAVDSARNLYIADTNNNRIRKVSNGVITTVAGSGAPGFSGDNGLAMNAALLQPAGVAVDSAGNLYIADTGNDRIRKVSNGVITTVAGIGAFGFQAVGDIGDNGPAISARLASPAGVAVDFAGNLYIADTGNDRIRRVLPNGIIITVAGGGAWWFDADNGPATNAWLDSPNGVAVDSAGNLYITDTFTDCSIREVSNGMIATVAGGAGAGFIGDGGPAISAQLAGPAGVAVDSAGNLYIAETANGRIRKVSHGVITTITGTGQNGSDGDSGPAASAQFNYPNGIAVDFAGNVYIADTGNNRIRVLTTSGSFCTYYVVPTSLQALSAGGKLTVSIQTAAGCSWVVSSLPGWITASGASSGSGSGSVTFAVSPNSGTALSATISVAGVSVTVTQPAAAKAPCAYSVGPTSLQAPSAGGNLTVGIQTTAACPWTISGLPSWITVSGASSGVGSATVTLVVFPNSGVPLGATVWIAGESVSVTQAAPTVKASPTSLNFACQAGGDAPSAAITVTGSADGLKFSVAVSAVSGGNWLSASPTSGVTPGSVTVSVNPSALKANTYTGTVVVSGASGAVGSANINITLTVTPALPTINTVTNAASYATGPVSPGEIVTIFGTAIGPATAAFATTDPATGKLATSIGGVQVLFNGVAAPMIYAGATQVSAVVPYEMASVASPSVWVKYAGQTSNAYQLTTAATAPGLFTQNSSGSGPGAILNQDNSVNGPGNAAAKGNIVQVYLTGEGQTSPPSVTGAITSASLPPPQVTPAPLLAVGVLINGQPASYVYDGEAPGLVAGMMQLNVQIPPNAPSGNLPITVSIGGNISQNGVTVSVQ